MDIRVCLKEDPQGRSVPAGACRDLLRNLALREKKRTADRFPILDEVLQDRSGDPIGDVPYHEDGSALACMVKIVRKDILAHDLDVFHLPYGLFEDLCEPPVDLDCDDMLGDSCELSGDRPQPGSNLEDVTRGGPRYLNDDRIEHRVIDEEILPQTLARVNSCRMEKGGDFLLRCQIVTGQCAR